MIACIIDSDHKNWCSLLQTAVFAYNTNVQESTKVSPFEIIYARKANLPADISTNSMQELPEIIRKFMKQRQQVRELIENEAKVNNLEAAETYSNQYNKNAYMPVSYKLGDK